MYVIHPEIAIGFLIKNIDFIYFLLIFILITLDFEFKFCFLMIVPHSYIAYSSDKYVFEILINKLFPIHLKK